MRSMRLIGSVAAALIATCALTGNAGGADTRAKADVACRPAAKLHYDCTIKLMNAATGEPLTGVDLTVNAEMPSMPMRTANALISHGLRGFQRGSSRDVRL